MGNDGTSTPKRAMTASKESTHTKELPSRALPSGTTSVAAAEMAFRVIELDSLDVSIWIHTAADFPQAEWAPACSVIADLVHARNGDVSRHRQFVVTDGGAPNAKQRDDLYRIAFRGSPVKVAVVTTVQRTNTVKRGVATAHQWLNPSFRVFKPQTILLAIEHIGITRAQFDSIWTTLALMQRTFPPNETLRLIARELRLSPLEPHAGR